MVARCARPWCDGEAPIPLLEDLLGAWPDLRVNIDCKSDAAVRALVSVLKRNAALDRVCVGAFSDRRMARLRAELGDGLCSALGPRGVAALRFARPRSLPAMTAQVPVTHGRLTVTDQRFVDARPRARHPRARVDRSTNRPRWSDCSTSVSTGS